MPERKPAELTLRQLANTSFSGIYRKLLSKEKLSDRESIQLLSISIVLINQQCSNLKRLGYRIALFYGNVSGNYDALNEIAINNGLIPVSSVISAEEELGGDRKDSFGFNYISSYIDNFRDGGMVLTEQQMDLRRYFLEKNEGSIAVIAPTSYGKSELIVKAFQDNPKASVCVLVPSKALLAQTKKRIIDAEIPELGKIVTHPEMYNELKPARAYVLTQERLARLQTDQPNLHFDIVFVDEAHNLLASDKRSELLASVICIAYSRNPAAAFKYLTPFLNDELSLSLRFVKENLSAFRISEYLKSERFYLCDFREGKGDRINSLYDHFLDRWYSTNKVYSDYFDFIRMNSLGKNIVYANKPKSIEMFAVDFAQSLPPVECPLIQKACIELELNFDKRYLLIECLRKGVVYHHGSMPDTVRYYVERLFSSSTHLKYLVSSSTLLEGVNLPIERLFILDQRKGRSNLDASQFKNLVGRVNRFSEVFSQKGRDALSRLESHVYLVGTDKYSSKRADLQGFYKKTVKVTNKVFDKVSNTLLLSTEINELNKAELKEAVERLENLEPGATSSKDVRRVSTQVGKQLIANSVTEIDIFAKEEKIQKSIEEFFAENSLISSPYELMLAIKMFFIDNLDESKGYSDLYRLKNEEALKFYSMLIGWKLNKYTIKQVIYNFVKYWNDRGEGEKNLVFVGKWGDTKFPDSHYEHWVDMSKKNDKEKINLAIVRIKEEDDYFDHKIFRFVEILNDQKVIDPDFFKLVKYGTVDDVKIRLIRDGFSRSLVDLILKKYRKTVSFDEFNQVVVSPRLVGLMRSEDESDLLILEATMNLRT